MEILLAILMICGWVLGIIGFFRARTALAELRDLRRVFAQYAAPQPVPTEAAPIPEATAPVDRVVPAEATEPAVASPAAPSLVQPTPKPARDLEALLTRRWGVWLGSAALLFAGVFLVRYAAEQALLGPVARCCLAALLGFALLAGAEWLQRHQGPAIAGPLRIDQAPAGLAAGAVAILFGASYGAGPFYDLLPPSLAFGAMAASSLIGLLAALRYGPLTAAIGIAGTFATPALVATQTPSLPGLFAYLFIVSVAALLVVRRTAWTWLGWVTMVAGAIWVCLAALWSTSDLWAAAVFVPAAACLNLFLLPSEALDHRVGRRLSWIPFAALAAAGLVLEAFAPGSAPRAGLFLLSPIAVWKGISEPRLDRLPWLAALFGLLALLFWALPAWNPTGEVISIDGVIQAILPGDWAPEVIRPLLAAAALFAAFHAAIGLRLERRAAHPARWAALVAAIPVLTLAVAYAQVGRFQSDAAWAAIALGLSAALTVTAARAAGEAAPQRAGIHAAGAVAALALGCAMLLHDQWLTLAVAAFLPPLAWIEARAELPPLRHVALAVAALILARLLLNWYVPYYAFGTTKLANGLLAAYAAPAGAFTLAAILFRRRADDLLVATLEAGGVTFMTCFIALEVRHWFGDGRLAGPSSFAEVALQLLMLAAQATFYLYIGQRSGRAMLQWAWRILGGIALAYAIALLVLNPLLTGAHASIFALLAGYLAPAILAVVARRRLPVSQLRQNLTIYAVVAGFAWITLQIRQLFHAGSIAVWTSPIEDAELWAWSGAWLAYGIVLMAQGIWANERLLRLIALGVIGLVCAKVFLIDMSDLTGLWRVLSFLGLGLALIGLGTIHRRFVQPGRDPA